MGINISPWGQVSSSLGLQSPQEDKAGALLGTLPSNWGTANDSWQQLKGKGGIKAELWQAKLQSMKRQNILRAVYLQEISVCMQITPNNNNSLEGIGKILWEAWNQTLPAMPPQSHVRHGWNDNHRSLIETFLWYHAAFRKMISMKNRVGGREIYYTEIYSFVVAERHALLLLLCKLLE